MKLFTVRSWCQSNLEIPGRKEPLFLGGIHVYSDVLPERIKYFVGEGKMTVTEVDDALRVEEKEVKPLRNMEEVRQEKPRTSKNTKES